MSDPFGGDGDRTVFQPSPGGRPGGAPPGGQGMPPPSGPPRQADLDQVAIRAGGSNGLIAAAAPLLSLASQLRATVSHPDPLSLQAHVSQEIAKFEGEARRRGEPPEAILAARYALCTLLDETVLSTPWGNESQWSSQTLLVRFHNESRGGEKFFQILERLLHDPARNLNLLELMYVCLALGFEGKYRLQARGSAELEQVKRSVYETIRNFRGQPEHELSIHWRGVEDPRSKLAQYVPLWVVGAVGAVIALLVYVGFLFALNADSDPVAGSIAQLARTSVPLETRTTMPVVQSVTLKDVLQADPGLASAMADGLIQIQEQDSSSLVRMWGLFPSGQGAVAPESEPLVAAVGQGLAQFEGRVRVVGHTDDQPIGSLRFPNNWILSETRADSVREVLARSVDPGRLTTEGLADSEPLVENDSAVNRALNRRVEITLYYSRGEL